MGNLPLRYDLLPFLRIQFGDRLRRDLTRLVLVWSGPSEVAFETVTRVRGRRMVERTDCALSTALDAETSPDAILEVLASDAYTWIMIADIFPPAEAKRIADEFEAEMDEVEAANGRGAGRSIAQPTVDKPRGRGRGRQ